MKTLILSFSLLTFLPILAATVSLNNVAIGVNTHPEHPGAAGSVTAEGPGAWKLHYDFTKGGHGLALVVTPAKPIRAAAIEFEAWHHESHAMCVIVRDATGQHLRKVARPAPGGWQKFVCELGTGWIGHWGGANDGLVHQPIRSFEVVLDRASKGTPVPTEVGDARVRNLTYREVDDEWEKRPTAGGSGVRYQVTDFRPGDVFSAWPRAFFRSDLQKRYDGGELEVNFAANREVRLYSEIPIWGKPQELLLTVEAPAESAGLEFSLVCRAGGPHVSYDCGALRKALPGERTICQTFSVPGFFGEGWRKAGGTKEMPKTPARSKRLMQLLVRRGKAPAKTLRLTPVRLEAVAAAGQSLPPLVPVPPKGVEPPTALEVGFLNLRPSVRAGASVRVDFTDWEGRPLGQASVSYPAVRPGERAFAKVPFPKVPADVNFVSCTCTLYDGARRDFDVGRWVTSWTRPLADAGSAEKNPDVPWGFGVYIHRSEDRYAYSSGYASPTNEAALVEMEKRAALAQAAGIKWERAEFKPSQANYARGKWEWSYYDKLFDIADRHGISCLGLWSHYFPTYDKAYTQQCYDDFIATLDLAARRYDGRIGAWEIWNEPNIHFWSGPKEDYPKLVDMAWKVLKAANPSNRVVACSTAGVPLEYIDKCVSTGMKFDDLSIHPYRANPAERGFLADLAAVTNRAHGNPSWLTEMGWPTGCDQTTYSEVEQAAYYARAYLTAAGSGCVHSIYGYNFVDDGFNVLERENNFGILRRDLTPKPSYRGIAKVCRTFTRGKATLEPVALTGGAEAWIFRMDGKAAVWAGRAVRVAVTTDGAATATNLMDERLGNPADRFETTVGPLKVVFFDRPVRTVTELGAVGESAGREPVEF